MNNTRGPSRALLALLVVTVFGAVGFAGKPAPKALPMPKECNPNSPCKGSMCAAAITTALATPPADACPREGEFQGDVDVFSWNSFIALNWPANTSTCGPNTGTSILTGKGPVVWETFPEDADIFVTPPATPGAWCSFNTATPARLGRLPQELREKAKRLGVTKVFHEQQKVSALLASRFPDIKEAFAGPLTDQNGRFVRYEKRLNLDEYNYLVTNKLWSSAGQLGATISFPFGPTQTPSPCGSKPCGPVGATEIKAAWKVLSPAEVTGGRFYMTQAFVFNDANLSPSPGANPVTVGLVGLHILHKTLSQQTWFWSTFEHVDNTTKSFFNPKCTPCPANQQTSTPPYTELNPKATPVNTPVQVTRVLPIATNDSSAPPLNTYYRALLAGSVWANYQLVGTQWATGGAPAGTPKYLGNTVLETYFQANSSCLGCHGGAKTTAGQPADFSFLLGEAYATPTPGAGR